MKTSKYNIWFTHRDKKFVYNAITCALAEVHNTELKEIENIPNLNDLTERQLTNLNKLKQSGFIVDDNVDELNIVKYRNYKGKFATKGLRLTILPTLACNFDCPYCFESRSKGFMID
jgi:uncharacterized protein